jgi:hypothetical protein
MLLTCFSLDAACPTIYRELPQLLKYHVITLIRPQPLPAPIIVWYTEKVVKQNIEQGNERIVNILFFFRFRKMMSFVVCFCSHLSGFIKINVVLFSCSHFRWQETSSEVLRTLSPLSLPAGAYGTSCSEFINAGTRIISTTSPENHRALTFPFKQHSKALLSNVSAWSYKHCGKLRIRVEEQYRFKSHRLLTQSSVKF